MVSLEEFSKTRMVVPFPGQKMASQLRRVCNKYNISVAFKSVNTIGSNLIKLKDPVHDDFKSGVVYEIPLNCGKIYIGETGRHWGKRRDEHIGYVRGYNVKDSAVLEHLVDCQDQCGHSNPGVKWDSCQILGQESHAGRRLALESLMIKQNSLKVVNRNEGSLGNEWCRALAHDFSADRSSGQSGRSGQFRRLERKRRNLNLTQIGDETRVKTVV